MTFLPFVTWPNLTATSVQEYCSFRAGLGGVTAKKEAYLRLLRMLLSLPANGFEDSSQNFSTLPKGLTAHRSIS